jgi:DNA topoisomerase IB
MVLFAHALPAARRRLAADLGLDGMPVEKTLALAVRLLDRGALRIGSEQYAEENETYGVATLLDEHVSVDGNLVTFSFVGKGGIVHTRSLRDPAVAKASRTLLRRRSSSRFLAYRDGRRWTEVTSDQVNAYLKAKIGDAFTAKDFRTWGGTVLGAVALASVDPGSRSATQTAVKMVAAHLGNTPAVCRASYIDPRLFDRYSGGETISPPLPRIDGDTSLAPRIGPRVERATLGLIDSD